MGIEKRFGPQKRTRFPKRSKDPKNLLSEEEFWSHFDLNAD